MLLVARIGLGREPTHHHAAAAAAAAAASAARETGPLPKRLHNSTEKIQKPSSKNEALTGVVCGRPTFSTFRYRFCVVFQSRQPASECRCTRRLLRLLWDGVAERGHSNAARITTEAQIAEPK